MPEYLPHRTVVGDRYVLEARIGDGGMGIVYRAHHTKVGRKFAIKVLHRSLVTNEKVVKRFEREAELAGRLSHTNVVSVVDVGETVDGARYLVMDLAPGISLAHVLADGPLSESRMLDLAKQLCAGLAHAHEVGLIHRDFKPENVIVEQQAGGREIARIVDFGVAILREDVETLSDERDRLTTKGVVVGTPHYMAPEQACAEPLDQRVDIFALGLICYEMLTGKLPFEGTGAEVVRANLAEPVPPMAVRAPGVHVDPELEAIVVSMLAKHREDRPENAHVVREMLEAYERRPPMMRSVPVVEPVAQERVILTDKINRIATKRKPWWLAIPVAALLGLLVPSHEVASAPNVEVETSDVTLSTSLQHRVYETPVPRTTPPPVQSILKMPPRNPQPVAIPAPSATEVAQLYALVGRQLKAYERDHGMDATIDYWPRYRWIRINEAIATAEKRNETFRMLTRLRNDLDTGG